MNQLFEALLGKTGFEGGLRGTLSLEVQNTVP